MTVSVDRTRGFLDAARDLVRDSPDGEFTVQEVVARSGQSLRSFYQHFHGKEELMLAVFEESVRVTADELRALYDGEDDPLAALHLLVVEYHRRCRASGVATAPVPVTSAMVELAQHLLLLQPADGARAFQPMVQLFDEAIAAAGASGAVRRDVAPSGVLLQAIMFDAFATTIGGGVVRTGQQSEELLWELFFNGIAA